MVIDDCKIVCFVLIEFFSMYLFLFVVGKLECWEYIWDGCIIVVYYWEIDFKKVVQLDIVFGQVMVLFYWFEEYIGIVYLFVKYDFIVLFGFQFGGMEYIGVILYNDNGIFLSEYFMLDEELNWVELIVYEMLYMWFGDLVIMDWFDDVWIKEVFVNYFVVWIVEFLFLEINYIQNKFKIFMVVLFFEDCIMGMNVIC